MKEIDEIYESLLFSIPQNNLGTEYKYGFQQGIALFKKVIDNSTVFSGKTSAQPEIIRCKDCEYGEQDEVGRWFCRSLGCQIGNEDGSGYCADAERRTDDANANA